MKQTRTTSRMLTVVADDYGIGPATSRAILELANEGRITASVLLVNAPDAERAVMAWQQAAPDADLGWHPNLTLDAPLALTVPSLVQEDGCFWPLGSFLQRVLRGRIAYAEVVREWTAQLDRFRELTGDWPAVVNSHQHVSLFEPCRSALIDVLRIHGLRPYVRRVVEGPTLWRVPGARLKRAFLNHFGRRTARRTHAAGMPGNNVLVGVTDPAYVEDEHFWTRWLRCVQQVARVEVCCHPGYRDATLWGRDCFTEASLERRPRETALLRLPSFQAALDAGGWQIVRPSSLEAQSLAGV